MTSGIEQRRRRVAQGLPRYTEKEAAARRKDRNLRTKRRRQEVAARIASLKVSLGCADCGFDQHPAALDFDHHPDAVKTANISAMVRDRRPWRIIEAELLKCEVVCANCHRIRTANRTEQQ